MTKYFLIFFSREFKISYNNCNEILQTLLFSLASNLLFIFSGDGESKSYALSGMITIYLLSLIISSSRIWHNDYQKGILDNIFIIKANLMSLIIAKLLNFLFFIAFPLLIISSIILYSYGFSNVEIKFIIKSLFFSLPIFISISFLISTLTFKIEEKFLTFLLNMPLQTPIIILLSLKLNHYINNEINYSFTFSLFFIDLILLPIILVTSYHALTSQLEND